MQVKSSAYEAQTGSHTQAQMQLRPPACLVYVFKGPQHHSLLCVHPASRPNELSFIYLQLLRKGRGVTIPSCSDGVTLSLGKLKKACCVQHSAIKPQHVTDLSAYLKPFLQLCQSSRLIVVFYIVSVSIKVYRLRRKLTLHLINLHLHLTLSLTRCYNKTNGALPLMHRMAPCQQDGLEMVPLGQVSPQCHVSDLEADAGFQTPDGNRESLPSQHSCCLIRNNENSPGDSTGD
ncbi:hypothetical protein GOODEAATRI_026632 [Goodea atripinnis]|uniref:Uncharacterized protein n=1 Tax=Goodea atripinnis TaxID=208336 RepID=A0ABV0PHE6_9TELE